MVIFCLSVGPRAAADAPSDIPGYVFWDAGKVDALSKGLYEKLGDKALVWETVGNYEGHSVYLVLRGKTRPAELHETESDVQITMGGKATFVIGGELVDAESLPRKQQRGSSIRGGTRHPLAPGDIMHIPPGVPHQHLIDQGEPYLYLLIKIDEEPLN